ncbi:hypothetical protein BGX23_012511 [Mortierella sp. AD031]|nr:hypothetical protein BGX23_012511 [Mortierella sp. AD031]
MVESLLETTSSKLTEGTKLALSTISHSGIIAHYFDPVIRYFHQLYIEQPKGSVVRLGMWGCLVGGLLPVGCLVGGVVMASVGCLVVSGSALLVIQMFCLGFTGCVLAPAGVLTALTVGLPSLALYGLYSSCNFLLSILSH